MKEIIFLYNPCPEKETCGASKVCGPCSICGGPAGYFSYLCYKCQECGAVVCE